MVDYKYKNVSCLVCGKSGKVKIRCSDGRILSKAFISFGSFNIAGLKTSKYNYIIKEDSNGKFIKDDKGFLQFKKIKNKSYDPKIKPHFIEYWECSKCFKKI